MSIVIDGEKLNISDVVKVSLEREKVEVLSDAESSVNRSNQYLNELIESDKAVYGVNTGVGELAGVRVERDKIRELQLNIIRSHSACVGEPAPDEVVRAIMLILSNTLLRGNSGIRFKVIKTIVDLLNRGVVPSVPEKGSIGASGDLAPLAHIALTLIGEGKVRYENKVVESREALKSVGIDPIVLEPKEGLSLINGCHYSTAILALQIHRIENLLLNSITALAMLIEIFKSPFSPFDDRVHTVRPHAGQRRVAEIIRALLEGSKVVGESSDKVQDAYSIRCYPQVAGAVLDTLSYARSICETEMNSSVDNPLLFADDEKYLSAGNFHGQPVAFACDFLSIAITSLSAMMERHINRLLDEKISGLPAYLTDDAGLKVGYMISQYTAASLLAENRVLSHPSSIEAIPVSGEQEDHQSMAPVSALKLRDIVENAETICAILLMCCAQGVELAGLKGKLGNGTGVAFERIRGIVPHLTNDRVISKDIDKLTKYVRKNELLGAEYFS